MTRIDASVLAAAAGILVMLSGCAGGSDLSEPPTQSSDASPSSSPTADPEPTTTPVDPADYATRLDTWGDGVDFDSVDANVHCGIWDDFIGSAPDGSESTGHYAGCRPALADYETDPSMMANGEVACRGGSIAADSVAVPVCNSGQAFVGEAPLDGTVSSLPVGSSISFAGMTCESLDAATISCARDSDGAGFEVSRTAYRYF